MSHPSSAAARLDKSARLAVLLEMDRRGLLSGRTLQQIADAFGNGLHRSTIMRDMRALSAMKLAVAQIWHQLDLQHLRIGHSGQSPAELEP